VGKSPPKDQTRLFFAFFTFLTCWTFPLSYLHKNGVWFSVYLRKWSAQPREIRRAYIEGGVVDIQQLACGILTKE
jgi:hypothetical protein